MSYLKNILIGIDQLGNTFAGGNPDNTISARVGYNYYHNSKIHFKQYWNSLRFIIDTTFYPLDGKGHCHSAYHNDDEIYYDDGTKNWAVAILSIIILITCIPISIVLYLLFITRIIRLDKDITIEH